MSFFQNQLITHPQAKKVREYIKHRGISQEMVSRFYLGFAPPGWDNLSGPLRREGFTNQVLEKAGLLKPGKKGGHYDVFRDRLMFPIIMRQDRVVGFGGRALDPDEPAKYLNTPSTPIFDKSRVMYGYHAARMAIGRKDRALIVEGNVDVVMMHQFGFDETVASLGTALTEDQIRLIKRGSANLVMVYDGDAAGLKAMYRSLERFLAEGVAVRSVEIPEGHDPDSFLREYGPEAMEDLLREAGYLFDNWLEDHYAARASGPRGVADCLETIIPMLARIANPVERTAYSQRIAERLNLPVEIVTRQLRRHHVSRNWDRGAVEATIQAARGEKPDIQRSAEEMLLSLLVYHPDQVAASFVEDGLVDRMRETPIKELVCASLDVMADGRKIGPQELLDRVHEKEWKNRVVQLLFHRGPGPEETARQSYADCLAVLNRRDLDQELEDLDERLRTDTTLDAEEKIRLQVRKVELLKRKQTRSETTT